jgi:hypothetical protein
VIIEQLQNQQDKDDTYFVDSVAARVMATSKHHCRSSSRCLSSRPFTSYKQQASQQQQAQQQQQQAQQQQQQQQAQQQAQQQQASTWEWNAPGGGKVREHKELSH